MRVPDAYWAGFFDAEGTLGIDKTLQLGVRLGNTNEEAVRLLGEDYPGTMYLSKKSRLPYWIWTCNSKIQKSFLKAIYPYSYIKKNQIDLSLEFLDLHESSFEHKLSQETLLKRFSYRVRLRVLKESDSSTPFNWTCDSEKFPYLAGLFDGDGTLFLDYTSPVVEIAGSSKNMEVLTKELAKGLGGLSRYTSGTYRLQLYGKSTLVFLKGVLPYLIIKRDKVRVLLAYYEANPMVGSGNRYK